MAKALKVLHERRDRKGRGAAAARVDGHEDVADVALGLAHVVEDGRRLARDHGVDVLGGEGLFAAVGRNAQGFAQTANGALPVRVYGKGWSVQDKN